MPTRVILAEDSYLMREGLKSLLDMTDEVELMATCIDGGELMAAVTELDPDVVLTDIRMPPTQTDEGIRAALQIRREHPNTGVVVLSQYAEPEYALRLLSEGSAGLAYLLKERVADLGVLLGAIEAVANKGSVVDPAVVDVLVSARIASETSLVGRLSPRETDVLSAMAQGLNNDAIAESLGVSRGAVEKHINSIFTKLDVSFDDEAHRRVRAVLLYLAGA
ncbi:MAG TPA: response regulator transcription factor [Acidimicrobiia bacterium]|nr:response regulator transcription factor [Acidimicrobiia bacterium]